MHETMHQFCNQLEIADKHETARAYSISLAQLDLWLAGKKLDPLRTTTQDLRDYQGWLAEEYRSSNGSLLERSTQATRLAAVKSYYRWLERRALIFMDVARKITLPRIRRRVTNKDYLTLQEATALLQTKMNLMKRFVSGSHHWARELQGLTLLSIAIASGRRRSSLLRIRVTDFDFVRDELRIEHEKGKAGRVLPMAHWAMTVAKMYVEQARPVLNWQFNNDWLFVGEKSSRMSESVFCKILEEVHHQTVQDNPDLEEFAKKYLTPHSLRVSFAKLLFQGGCNIRSINELMDHKNLTTTACYTPLHIDDLRRACQKAHPRA